MKEAALLDVHLKMTVDLESFGAIIDDIAYCPHQPKAGCACRKPKPKMILDLADKHQVDLAKSYMIGDRESDIKAGKEAGVKTILIGESNERQEVQADMHYSNLFSAAKTIAGQV